MKGKSVSKTLTKLFVLLAAVFALMAFGACGKEGTGDTIGISPASTIWVKGESHDLVFPYAGGLTAVEENGTALAAENYTAAEGTLTVKESYLASLPRGVHTFTAVFGEKRVEFSVACYEMPAVAPAEVRYDWNDPADVVLTVDLGGAALVSVTVGGEALGESEYTLSGDTLTLSQSAIESRCSNGDNACEVKTDVGSAAFNLSAMTSEVSFDSVRYKMQEEGKDVRFEFYAGREEWTIESLIGGKYAYFARENYSYEIGSLTIRSSYLNRLDAGTYTFRIFAGDETFWFAVGAYGREGTAHPIDGTVYSMNNFDCFAAGSSVLGSDETQDPFFKTIGGTDTVVEGKDAIGGKSLKLTTTDAGAAADWNTLFGARLPFRMGTTYFVTMKVKQLSTGKANPTLVFRLDGPEQNMLWLNYNTAADSYMASEVTPLGAPSSFSYDKTAKTVTVSLYVSPSAEGQHFRFMTANAGAAEIVIDDFAVLATGIPTGSPVLGSGKYSTESKGDCSVPFTLPAGYTVKEVRLDGETLAEDAYALGAGTVTLKESAFAGFGSGMYELSVIVEAMSDAFGAKTEREVTSFVQIYASALAGLKGEKTQKQTAQKEPLTWSVESGPYVLAGVQMDGVTVDAGMFLYEGNTFTLKPEFLSSLAPGAHTVTLAFEQEDMDGVFVELTAVSYGNDVAQLDGEIGYLDFSQYAEGTAGSDIYPASRLRSWNNGSRVTVVSDPVFGRALNIPLAVSAAGVLSFENTEADAVYVLRMVFRTADNEPVKSLLIKRQQPTEQDLSWIENNEPKSDTRDARTTFTQDPLTKAYTWTSYLPKAAAGAQQFILWPVVGQELNIGSIELFKTSLESNAGSWKKYNYLAVDGETWTDSAAVEFSDENTPLKIVQNMNDESRKYQHFSLMLGTRTLVKDVDYTAEGEFSHQNITLTPDFLKTVKGSVVLTVCRGSDGVLGIDGKMFLQTAHVTVTRV